MKPLRRTPPTVDYDIKPILRPMPGRSYLGFACGNCERPIAMLNDSGPSHATKGPAASFEVRCPACGTTGTYNSADLRPFAA